MRDDMDLGRPVREPCRMAGAGSTAVTRPAKSQMTGNGGSGYRYAKTG
jgi:hypothetical protein